MVGRYIMIKETKFSVIFLAILLMVVFSHSGFAVCTQGSYLQKSRSRELQHLRADDQLDREGFLETSTEKEIAKLQKKDLERRKRVAEIFAEGCLKSAEDYMAAALIYQHGDTPVSEQSNNVLI
jgi:hypothetical protein